MERLLIGVVADDFTGAGDAASFLSGNGIKTLLTDGLPPADAGFDADLGAVVIALKSRTQPTAAAVADTLAAFDWLRDRGAGTLYFKYCSTFDSTPTGNIGPVIDAVLERYNFDRTILCPALPINGRTVKDGILYVGGTPLAESHMKEHPLTPMWASSLVELMRPQGKYPCHTLTLSDIRERGAVQKLAAWGAEGRHYIATDFCSESDGDRLAMLFYDLPFMTGGSGLLAPFARYHTGGKSATITLAPEGEGRRLLFAGSCSVATRGQVAAYLAAGKAGIMLHPKQLASGEQTVASLFAAYEADPMADLLFYSAGSGGVVEQAGADDAALLEQTMAALAAKAVDAGCTRLIVAGGETSGAVTQALGCTAYYIGETVAPGVPIMMPSERPKLRIVLKSGNFGDPEFFLHALASAEVTA